MGGMAEVFHRAMRLYIAVKNRQPDQEGRDPESPLRVFLEDVHGKTKVTGLERSSTGAMTPGHRENRTTSPWNVLSA